MTLPVLLNELCGRNVPLLYELIFCGVMYMLIKLFNLRQIQVLIFGWRPVLWWNCRFADNCCLIAVLDDELPQLFWVIIRSGQPVARDCIFRDVNPVCEVPNLVNVLLEEHWTHVVICDGDEDLVCCCCCRICIGEVLFKQWFVVDVSCRFHYLS